jgi:hypothetical protein
MRPISALLICVLLSTLGACDRVFSDLVVRNGSSVKISGIVLEQGDVRAQLGDLDPGSETRFSGYLPGEGAPVIHYTAKGRRMSFESCYFTGGMPPRGEVTISDNGATRACH